MAGKWRYYLGNLQKICNIIGPKNLRKIVNKLNCNQYLDSQFLWTQFFFMFLDQQDHTFSEDFEINVFTSIFVLETLKFESVPWIECDLWSCVVWQDILSGQAFECLYLIKK